MTLPEEDKQHVFKSKLMDEITMMLGGRVAEALTLKDISTGAINDLQRATETAKDMVTKYGMSEETGRCSWPPGTRCFAAISDSLRSIRKVRRHALTRKSPISWKAHMQIDGNPEQNLRKLVNIGEVLMRRKSCLARNSSSSLRMRYG